MPSPRNIMCAGPQGQIPIIYEHDEIHRALMKAKALILDNEKAI